MKIKSEPLTDPREHAPHCDQPGFEWQQQIRPGLPLRGRCMGCGAIAIDRPQRPGAGRKGWVA